MQFCANGASHYLMETLAEQSLLEPFNKVSVDATKDKSPSIYLFINCNPPPLIPIFPRIELLNPGISIGFEI